MSRRCRLIADAPAEVFHPYAALILSIVADEVRLPIRDLSRRLQTTSANLATHLRVLEREGYVSLTTETVDGRPRVNCEITLEGIHFLHKLLHFVRRFEHENPVVPLGKDGSSLFGGPKSTRPNDVHKGRRG